MGYLYSLDTRMPRITYLPLSFNSTNTVGGVNNLHVISLCIVTAKFLRLSPKYKKTQPQQFYQIPYGEFPRLTYITIDLGLV